MGDIMGTTATGANASIRMDDNLSEPSKAQRVFPTNKKAGTACSISGFWANAFLGNSCKPIRATPAEIQFSVTPYKPPNVAAPVHHLFSLLLSPL